MWEPPRVLLENPGGHHFHLASEILGVGSHGLVRLLAALTCVYSEHTLYVVPGLIVARSARRTNYSREPSILTSYMIRSCAVV
jgi:hypothetical protein